MLFSHLKATFYIALNKKMLKQKYMKLTALIAFSVVKKTNEG